MHIKKEEYVKKLNPELDKKIIAKNVLVAFFFGGTIGVIGEILRVCYIDIFNFDTATAGTLMIMTMILFSAVLSAFGVYDRIGQIAKCGLAIPITGFANSVISSAMEYKPEGFLLGIGANAFKLAGSVIVLGVFSAVTFNLIRFVIEVFL